MEAAHGSGVHAWLASLVAEDDALVAARATAPRSAAGWDGPLVGRLLHLLVGACEATRVLQVGTGTGYTTIWLARAVGASGRVVSLTADAAAAASARAHLEAAGVGAWVDIWVGDPTAVAERMAGAQVPAFDMVVVDAVPDDLPAALDRVAALTGPGALLVVDRVGPDAAGPALADVAGALTADVRWETTAVPAGGVAGHDGLVLARRVS